MPKCALLVYLIVVLAGQCTLYIGQSLILFVYCATVLMMQLKILETCVDEILVFGVEAAAMYADHVVCAPASKSYFHYILNRCIRHD